MKKCCRQLLFTYIIAFFCILCMALFFVPRSIMIGSKCQYYIARSTLIGTKLHMKYMENYSKSFSENNIVSIVNNFTELNKNFCQFSIKGEKFRKFTGTAGFYSYHLKGEWKTQKMTRMHFRNTYFSPLGLYGYVDDDKFCAYKTLLYEKEINNNLTFDGYFENVIMSGYVNLNYGHYIWEYLTSLFTFPKEIFLISYIFIPINYNATVELLREIFNVDDTKCICITSDNLRNLYFAGNLHTFSLKTQYYNNMIAGIDFAALIKSKYPNPKPAYRYFLHNRKKNTKRCIPNFNELVSSVRNKFSNIKWEILPINYYSIMTAFHDFQQIKLVFFPSGSIILNTIFLQPKSVVVDCMTSQFVPNDALLAAYTEFYLVAFCWNTNLYHHSGNFGKTPVPINETLYYFEIGINISTSGQYPKGIIKPIGQYDCLF